MSRPKSQFEPIFIIALASYNYLQDSQLAIAYICCTGTAVCDHYMLSESRMTDSASKPQNLKSFTILLIGVSNEFNCQAAIVTVTCLCRYTAVVTPSCSNIATHIYLYRICAWL